MQYSVVQLCGAYKQVFFIIMDIFLIENGKINNDTVHVLVQIFITQVLLLTSTPRDPCAEYTMNEMEATATYRF